MSSRKKKFRKRKISNEKIQQLPGLIFVGFIRIYQKILMHFEIDLTQFRVWGDCQSEGKGEGQSEGEGESDTEGDEGGGASEGALKS